MSDPVTIALIASAPTLLAAVGSLIVSLLNFFRGRRSEQIINATHEEVRIVKADVNGKMAQLLEATGAKERAAGVVEGRQAGINERAARVTEEERKEDRDAAHEADRKKP